MSLAIQVRKYVFASPKLKAVVSFTSKKLAGLLGNRYTENLTRAAYEVAGEVSKGQILHVSFDHIGIPMIDLIGREYGSVRVIVFNPLSKYSIGFGSALDRFNLRLVFQGPDKLVGSLRILRRLAMDFKKRFPEDLFRLTYWIRELFKSKIFNFDEFKLLAGLILRFSRKTNDSKLVNCYLNSLGHYFNNLRRDKKIDVLELKTYERIIRRVILEFGPLLDDKKPIFPLLVKNILDKAYQSIQDIPGWFEQLVRLKRIGRENSWNYNKLFDVPICLLSLAEFSAQIDKLEAGEYSHLNWL